MLLFASSLHLSIHVSHQNIFPIFSAISGSQPDKLQGERKIHMGGRLITVIGAVTGAAFSTLIAVYYNKYYKPKKYGKK